MRKRDEQAISGDKAELAVSMKFLERGWTAQKVTPDYGEDLMVRIFEDGASTPYIFFVQVKGMKAHGLTQKRKQYDYSIENDHYESWMSFWQPMFLVVWDHSNQSGRWEWVQHPEKAPQETITKAKRGSAATQQVSQILGLPHELTDEGLQHMADLVRRHYRESVMKEVIQDELNMIAYEDFQVDQSISGEVGLSLSPERSELVLTMPAFNRIRDVLTPLLRARRDVSDAEIPALVERVIRQFIKEQLPAVEDEDDWNSSAVQEAKQKLAILIENTNAEQHRSPVSARDDDEV